MSKINDGGAAFPGPFSGHCGEEDHLAPCACYVDKGMTLRDYFAIRVLPLVGMGLPNKDAAREAYVLADAMIAAREE